MVSKWNISRTRWLLKHISTCSSPWLLAQESFISFSHHGGFRLYSCFLLVNTECEQPHMEETDDDFLSVSTLKSTWCFAS